MRTTAIPAPDDRFLMEVLGKYELEWRTREAAVGLFEDETVLDLLAAADGSWAVADAAAHRSVELAEARAGEAGLAALVREASSSRVRALAAARLTDPETLAAIATHDFDDRVRLAAVQRIDDPELLAYLARADAHWEVRLAATRRIDDQSALAEVATTDVNAEVRYAAVQRVTGHGTLAIVAAVDADEEVSSLASIRLALRRLPRG